MFRPDVSQVGLKMSAADGRFGSDMDNMDIMLTYDNNDLLSSEFFDTIRSVEDGIQDDFLTSSADDFNTLSDNSLQTDGTLSPRNGNSESERSSEYAEFTDESGSPMRTIDLTDNTIFDFLATPLDNNFQIQDNPIIIKQPKATKFLIQNPPTNNRKIVNKQIINPSQIKKIGKSKVLKVQSLTANGKPILLPLKTIKVVNANQIKGERFHVTTIPAPTACKRRIETIKIEDESDFSISAPELTPLKLTPEEKRLLAKEGIDLPTHHPLTKIEDRELKRIRRKIRNKISAQDSRKRKKEYVDGLEDRVRRGSEENRNLMQRIKELQLKNKTLMAHISKLQSMIFNSSSSKATPSTCLMIVMLSALLVSLPNMKLSQQTTSSNEMTTQAQQSTVASAEREQVTISRGLLSTNKATSESSEEDAINMDELFNFSKGDESSAVFDYIKFFEDNENNTDKELYKVIEEIESKYGAGGVGSAGGGGFNFEEESPFTSFVNNMKSLFGRKMADMQSQQQQFIEPEIDEFDYSFASRNSLNSEPATKRMKFVDDCYHQHDENFVPNSNNVVSATVVQTNSIVGDRKYE